MSAITTAAQLRDLSPADLATKLAESKEELFNLRFQAATGQLENHGRLRTVRRDIARIYTVLRERELGITEPGDGPGPDDETAEDDTAKSGEGAA